MLNETSSPVFLLTVILPVSFATGTPFLVRRRVKDAFDEYRFMESVSLSTLMYFAMFGSRDFTAALAFATSCSAESFASVELLE